MIVTPFDVAARTWMQGAIAMGYLVVALFFVSFWAETRARLFLFFTCGFLTLAIHRTIFALTFGDPVWDQFSFALRLIGYLIILAGIIDRRLRPAASASPAAATQTSAPDESPTRP